MSLRNTLAATVAALTLVAAPLTGPALAQTQEAAPAEAPAVTAPPPAMASDLSEEKLEAFVDAAVDVRDVQRDYQAKVETAASDAERQDLATQAREKMQAAVNEAEGVTLEEYMAIGQAAQTDPELMQRITAMLQAREAPSGG